MLSPGTRVGPYEIVSWLGAGGMGAVYEAVHEAIDRKVALKCLHAEYARQKDIVARFRRDVLEAARPLAFPILRWPGGNFVSGYHWLDGVGPKDERPRRSELAWYAEESNRFGTNEFIEYCREVGTEPFICVNMGSGTMDEAQAWLEYCNGTGNTSWANLRRRHGYAEPHRVRYWGLGNEMYGGWQIGNLEARDYVKRARAFAGDGDHFGQIGRTRWAASPSRFAICRHDVMISAQPIGLARTG